MPHIDVVTDPAALIRVAAVLRRVRDEIGTDPIDEATRTRLHRLLRNSVEELEGCLSPSLYAELTLLVPTVGADVRIAHAALLGWLDGVLNYVRLRQRQTQGARTEAPSGSGRPLA